jgi:hypothetical protein
MELHRRAAITDQSTSKCTGEVRLAGPWWARKEQGWTIGAKDLQRTLQQDGI